MLFKKNSLNFFFFINLIIRLLFKKFNKLFNIINYKYIINE